MSLGRTKGGMLEYNKFQRWKQRAGLLSVDALFDSIYAMTTEPTTYMYTFQVISTEKLTPVAAG